MTTAWETAMAAAAPLHWWRFHNLQVSGAQGLDHEPDLGSSGTNRPVTAGAGGFWPGVAGPLVGQTTRGVNLDASGGNAALIYGNGATPDFNPLTPTVAFGANGMTRGSVAFWFRSQIKGRDQVLIKHEYTVGGSRTFWGFVLQNGGKVYFLAASADIANNCAVYTPDNDYDDGSWHFAVYVHGTGSSSQWYMDGAAVSQTTTTQGAGLGTTNPWFSNLAAAVYGSGSVAGVGKSGIYTGAYPQSDVSEVAYFADEVSSGTVAALWAARESLVVPTTVRHKRQVFGV